MKKWFSLVMAVLLMFGVLAGCGGGEETKTQEQTQENAVAPIENAEEVVVIAADEEEMAEKLTEDGTIVVGVYGYTMGNLRASQSRNYAVTGQVYDTLFTQDRTGEVWEISNVLCEDYEYYQDENGTWIFHLKIVEGATFASGEEIVAEDVLWSIQDMLTGSFAAKFVDVDFDNAWMEGNYDLYLPLLKYDPNFLEAFTTPNLGIQNKSWAENASEEDWWDQIDESGPFELVEMVNGSHALMKVRDDYWGWKDGAERPAYDYLKVIFYGEAATMVIDFENGDIDVACSLAASDVTRIMDNGGMEHATLSVIPTGTMMSLVFNQNTPALQDPVVRKAIALCIDAEAITDAVAGYLGVVSTGYISPGPAGDAFVDFGVNEYDPAKAKTMLEEAGYNSGDINLTMVIKNTEGDQNFATILQAALSEIGIGLEVQEYETSTAIQMFREGGTDLCFNLFSSGLHPKVVYTNRQSDTTLLTVEFLDDDIQAKITEAGVQEDIEVANELYREIQNYQHDECTEVPLYEQLGTVLYKDYIDASSVLLYQLSGVLDFRNLDLIAE